LKLSIGILYSFPAKRRFAEFIDIVKPDLIHLNNFAHQISPSILHAIRRRRIPVVMTMHDYKLVCPAYTLQRDGAVCELCTHGRFFWCAVKSCIKHSRLESVLGSMEMYLHHRVLRIYGNIDRFISPSIFLRDKLAGMGFRHRIDFLPNFVDPDHYPGADEVREPRTIVYVGRLSPEKGLVTLLGAVRDIDDVILKVIGDGPMSQELRHFVAINGIRDKVRFLGHIDTERCKHEISGCTASVCPSEWYENNPRSILESFASRVPVVGARIGGIPELVRDDETGYLFIPGDADDLREKIVRILDHPKESLRMGENAFGVVKKCFNPSLHYERLMDIYNSVSASKRPREMLVCGK
jgi:glycosyltransferase involved in cell wall biosynthesis